MTEMKPDGNRKKKEGGFFRDRMRGRLRDTIDETMREAIPLGKRKYTW